MYAKLIKFRWKFKKSTPQIDATDSKKYVLELILFLSLYQGQLPIFPKSFTKYQLNGK